MPLESIEDPAIKIKPSKKLISFLLKHIDNTNATPINIAALKEDSKEENPKVTLLYNDIKWVKEFLDEYREKTKQKVYLHELLEDAEIKLPIPKVSPRNPELDARIQKLIAQQNAREYKAMTKGVDPVGRCLPEDTISYQIKQMNRQLIAVAQFIFSVLAGFAFGFIGIELIVGNLDFGFRLLLGIMCALVIALAEIYFLAIKLNEDVIDFVPQSEPRKLHQD